MPRSLIRATFVVTLLAATACTQPPAQVDVKGHYHFGRSKIDEGYSDNRPAAYVRPYARASYRPAAPVYANNTSSLSQPTSQTVSVQSIGVSDLSPPAKNSAAATPRVASKPIVANSKPVNLAANSREVNLYRHGDSGAQPVNKWTNREHFSDASDTTRPRSAVQSQGSYMWPVNGKKVVSNFGPKGAGKVNDGINIAAENGEPVWAAAEGEVIYVGNELQGYGNMVIIKHTGGKNTTYAHLGSANVEKYDRVQQGDIIGYVGSTGNVKSPQLHFAVRDGKTPVDPEKYLSRSVAGL